MIFPSRRTKLFGFLDHGHSLTLASENKLLTGLILAVAVIKKLGNIVLEENLSE